MYRLLYRTVREVGIVLEAALKERNEFEFSLKLSLSDIKRIDLRNAM